MSIASPGTVDELLNYRLNTLLASSGALTTRRCEGRFGITRREWRLIALLAAHGSMSPTTLSERANLELDRVSKLLATLRDKGLVQRVPDGTDRRRALLTLTARGRHVHAQLFPISVGIHQAVLSVLSPDELALLDAFLQRLTERARQLDREDDHGLKADRRHGGSRRLRPPPETSGTRLFS